LIVAAIVGVVIAVTRSGVLPHQRTAEETTHLAGPVCGVSV